jgi:formylglycine-generating enzyme required for sulfatase activity
LTAASLCSQIHAQIEAQLDIETYAGLTITGKVGKVYSVEYVTQLDQQEEWKCLEYVQLLQSPHLWTDKSAPAKAKRFYRAVQMDAPTNMVWIPPGTFRMGSPTNEVDRREEEGAQTEVTLTRGFWMGKFEVTEGEYRMVTGKDSDGLSVGDDYPAILEQGDDPWGRAMEYCETLTQQELAAGRIPGNCVFRLPTEAEWEYACRAWTSTRFSYGDDPAYEHLDEYAWHQDNSGGGYHQVGKKRPNGWGLYDMHGNVAEWCLDEWGEYTGGSVIDPQPRVTGLGKVFRGGWWSGPAEVGRSDSRHWLIGGPCGCVGFRVVLAPVVFRPQANMVYIPPGTFLMGSPEDEEDRISNEGPQTQVTLTKGFWMGKYEVRQGEYLAVMGNNPSYFYSVKEETDYGTDPNRPVESVSWEDAVAYCEALTQQERAAGRIANDYSYRLPAEAEWEYACRAGTSTRFSYGDDPDYSELADYAWFDENSGRMTHPAGEKLPNPWGLYDMHGNVYEWCYGFADWYLPGGTLTDPLMSAEPRFRGGSVWYPRWVCRSADRCCDGFPDVMTTKTTGFRIVLSRVRQ